MVNRLAFKLKAEVGSRLDRAKVNSQILLMFFLIYLFILWGGGGGGGSGLRSVQHK